MGKKLKDCYDCEFWRRVTSKLAGRKIPDGKGKCIRPEGHCDPDIVKGEIGNPPILRKNKTRDDTQIKNDSEACCERSTEECATRLR